MSTLRFKQWQNKAKNTISKIQQYKDIIAVKYDKLTSNKFAIVRGGSSRDVEKREMVICRGLLQIDKFKFSLVVDTVPEIAIISLYDVTTLSDFHLIVSENEDPIKM